MPQPLELLNESSSQTGGPYIHIGAVPNFCGITGVYPEDLGGTPFPSHAPGERITITGQVLDGTGAALKDAMIETWQAGADGGFGPGAQGFARVVADQTSGDWTLTTVKPGAVTLRDGRVQAPHIALWIAARGINIGLQTRMYFEGDDHDADPVLSRIEHRGRVGTLIAKATGPGLYRFDVRLQGEGETVFLDM